MKKLFLYILLAISISSSTLVNAKSDRFSLEIPTVNLAAMRKFACLFSVVSSMSVFQTRATKHHAANRKASLLKHLIWYCKNIVIHAIAPFILINIVEKFHKSQFQSAPADLTVMLAAVIASAYVGSQLQQLE